MLKLRSGCLYATAVGTPDVLDWLHQYLRVEHKDGSYEDLFDRDKLTFPAGLVPVVMKAARATGLAPELDTSGLPPQLERLAPDLSWLRGYQREAVDVFRKHDRGIIWAPPGAGKGEIAVALGMLLPGRTVYLVHRTNLAQDIAERWTARTGRHAGLVANGKWDVLDDDAFVCCTFSALHSAFQRSHLRAEDLVETTTALLVDECQTTAARSHRAALARFDRAWVRIGLSGTPLDRSDGRDLVTVGALGPVRFRIPAERLVQEGAILRGEVVFAKNHVSSYPTIVPWERVYENAVVKSATRNRLVAEVTAEAFKPCIVFAVRDEHGTRLTQAMKGVGLRVEHVWGETPVEGRAEAARKLASGELDVVVASVVWQEGLDIPGLRSVVNAAGDKSIIATIQRSGRGARIAPGKQGYRVYDIYDTGSRGSFFLTRRSQARHDAYAREAHTITWLHEEKTAGVGGVSKWQG